MKIPTIIFYVSKIGCPAYLSLGQYNHQKVTILSVYKPFLRELEVTRDEHNNNFMLNLSIYCDAGDYNLEINKSIK